MLKISIITINLNNSKGLETTIQSVIQQTYKNIEYIVIDGGSTDGSLNIIKKYEDKIAYWVNEPDTGIYNAMNKGLKSAKGEFILFLNSGDCLTHKNVIERVAPELTANCEILYGNILKNFNNKPLRDNGFGGKTPKMTYFYRGTLNHSSSFIKKALFNKFGLYDESFKIVSDWKWFFNAIIFNDVPILYKNIDIAIIDMNGISTTNSVLVKKERDIVLQQIFPNKINQEFDRLSNLDIQIERVLKKRLFSLVYKTLIKLSTFKIIKMKKLLKLLIPKYMLSVFHNYKDEKQYKKWNKMGRPIPPPPIVKRKIISEYQKKYNYSILVETGTRYGDMVEGQRKNFNRIYSIELDDKLYSFASKRFKRYKHINIIHGDSGKVLPIILKEIDQPCIFWLDAHYTNETTAHGDKESPIIEEINHIKKNVKKDHIIIIDDARLFTGSNDYPTIESLTKSIKEINPNYKFVVADDVIRIFFEN